MGVAIISTGSASSFGFIGSSGSFWGFANQIPVSTSAYYIPLFGDLSSSSNIYDLGLAGNSIGSLYLNLDAPLPSGAGTLTFNIKNITTGNFLGNGTITSGNSSGSHTGGSLAVNAGDQVMLYVDVSGSSIVLPSFQWHS